MDTLIKELSSLIPSKSIEMYGHTVTVHPLTLSQISNIVSKLSLHKKTLEDLDVTVDKLSSDDNQETVSKLLLYLISKCPDILADLSGLSAEVFEKLPFDKSVEILTAVIELNLESKDTLLKNLSSLANITSGLIK